MVAKSQKKIKGKAKPQKPVLIKNYGLFWEHDKVDWGEKPSLVGYSSKMKDCCFNEQIGIYVLYNENKEILYVGQAGNGAANLLSRLKTHNRDHLEGWWTYFSWFGLIGLSAKGCLLKFSKESFHADKDKLLDSLEGILIAAINPKLNKQGEKLGVRFKQTIKEEKSETGLLLEKIDILSKKIKELESITK